MSRFPIHRRLALAAAALAVAACSTTPTTVAEPRRVRLCDGGECREAPATADAGHLARQLHELLRANDGTPFTLCSADPASHDCIGDDIGYVVLGGYTLPGRGSSGTGTASQVRLGEDGRSVQYRMATALRFLGIPLACAEHDAVLTVAPEGTVSLRDADYRCTWLKFAVMSASFGVDVDWVDLDRGRLGGRWQHRVAGMAIGRGDGYAVIGFPHPATAR